MKITIEDHNLTLEQVNREVENIRQHMNDAFNVDLTFHFKGVPNKVTLVFEDTE